MIVIAVIGVLAALAIYGVRRYLAASKTAEAKEMIGKISSSAHAGFERELAPAQNMGEGALSQQVSHELCGSAVPVPQNVPAGKKYQPITQMPQDFGTGNDRNGWICLRFQVSQPIYYQYHYNKDSSTAAPANPSACNADCYEAGAVGDVDADGTFSRFARTGMINTQTGALRASTEIFIEQEME
jgi:type IV pilus assembly protein PilA